MIKNIYYRPAEKSDISQLVSLMNVQYARKKNRQYFLWQYFNSAHPTILMVALTNQKVIGMFGLQKRELNNGAIVGQALDLLIVPQWRGKGIFKKLAKKAIEYFSDIEILCVFPNLNGKNACEKGLGWRTLSKINSMSLKEVDLVKEPMKGIEKPRYKRDLIRFKYNPRIRKWRFNQHPEYKYSKVGFNSHKFATVKIFRDPLSRQRYGDIVDFECNINDGLALEKLFLKASLYLRKHGLKTITTWALPHTYLYRVIRSLGFVEMPQERYFCLKVLNPKYKNLYNFSNWHLVQADAEIY